MFRGDSVQPSHLRFRRVGLLGVELWIGLRKLIEDCLLFDGYNIMTGEETWRPDIYDVENRLRSILLEYSHAADWWRVCAYSLLAVFWGSMYYSILYYTLFVISTKESFVLGHITPKRLNRTECTLEALPILNQVSTESIKQVRLGYNSASRKRHFIHRILRGNFCTSRY